MKKLWLLIVTMLGSSFLLLGADTLFSEILQKEIAKEVIRFHVRADDNSDSAQAVKLKVKDAVAAYLQPILREADSAKQAKEVLESHLPEIEKVAKEYAAVAAGCNIEEAICVSVRNEYFPEKVYGECYFPSGRYQALIIELGEAKGRNWWCMLYPGLCFIPESYCAVSSTESVTKGEEGTVQNQENAADYEHRMEEERTKLRSSLSDDAYDRITDPQYRKIGFRIRWLNRLLNFPLIQGNIK